ncbi:MAG: VWA domain-containing protein [Spirochaetales bacterium]|nr:VWA domain-containing protein [Spirochaetales bacterium]
MGINEILEDLYMLDPALKSEEAELKKIIEKLISRKPEAEPDEEFKARLKSELLDMMEQKRRRKGFFVMHRKAVLGAAVGLAAALVLVMTFAIRPAMMNEPSAHGAKEAAENFYADESEILAGKTEAPMPAVSEMKRRNTRAEAPVTGFSMAADEIAEYEKDDDFAADRLTGNNELNTEEYNRIFENDFLKAAEAPLSTFSIDVDTASYSNVRRYITGGSMPPPDAVRIEELVNYFTYDYPQPEGDLPFSIVTEFASCPWNSEHGLLHIGLQGLTVDKDEIPQSNLVFLIDASGSMEDENKLPLLKKSLSLLVKELRPEDRVSIVAYAGAAGLVLPTVAGNDNDAIMAALDNLYAGGSTAGGEGIDLAYRVAAKNLIVGGNNRVILATDGDFNVGQSSEAELVRMIEERRNQGVFLTVLGLGMGNYKDTRMESLADKGNGNYAYIDTLSEARKVLVNEISSTLFTIAKDVKIQIEFNPAKVESYRLIGYENRLMAARDFDDDTKDAGEIGAGHSVTALYEIIPAEGPAGTQELRYQSWTAAPAAEDSGELGFIKFRYKQPNEDQSRLIELPVSAGHVTMVSSENFRFSAAVAEWGLILRSSKYAARADLDNVIQAVRDSLGQDEYGYRAEFLGLLYKTRELMGISGNRE